MAEKKETSEKSKKVSIRRAKIKEESIVKAARKNLKETFFYQPYAITMLKADLPPLQINIIIQILERFQEGFKEQIRLKMRGLPLSDYDIFNGEGSPIIKIPFKDLDVRTHEYDSVKAATDQLKQFRIEGEYLSKDGEQRERSLSLFTMIDTPAREEDKSKDLKKKRLRLGYVELQLNQAVAQSVLRIDSRYTKFLKEITRGRKSCYTPRMYMLTANNADFGKWSIDYIELRKILGLTITKEISGITVEETTKYPIFYDFKRRVLDPPMAELKALAEENKVDCYYDYKLEYPIGKKKGDPTVINFFIRKTSLGLALESQTRSLKEQSDLFATLTKEFHFEESDNKILEKMITSDNMESFKSKVNEVKTYVTDPKNKVRSVKLYAFKSLREFLRKMQPVEQEQTVVQEVPKESTNIPVAEEKPQLSLSPEEEVRWALAQEKMARYSTDEQCKLWFSSLKLEKIESNELLIIVPNPFIYNMIENKYLAVLDKSIHEVYGEDAEVCYRLAAQ